MDALSEEQSYQESQYRFPYHYLDLEVPEYRFRLAEYRSLLKLVRERVGSSENVLDAGCGDGRVCYELAHHGARVVGVDHSAQAIGFARAFNPLTEFHVGDIAELDLGRSFDTITLIEVFEHVDPVHAPMMLEGLRRHLAPGGRLIISVPSSNTPVAPKHYRHFDDTSLAQALLPYFAISELDGYLAMGTRRSYFQCARRAIYVLLPVLRADHVRQALADRLERYFERYLAIGPAAQMSRAHRHLRRRDIRAASLLADHRPMSPSLVT